MDSEVKAINIDDWEVSGGGGNGLSYNHRRDDSVVLKMNKASLPKEHTVREFQMSKWLYELGVSCPKVVDIVTDGERFGLVVEKVKDKKSFARIISDDPCQLATLARTLAHEARLLHQVRCDNGIAPSYREAYLNELSHDKNLSDNEKIILKKALCAMDDAVFCIHGDLTPGNIIRASNKDYWIDLGDVTYGDPDIDFGNMLFVSYHIPPRLIGYLYHISRKQFREFTEIYAQEYFGERWGTPELDEKLHNVLLLKVGLSVLKHPASGFFYRPFIKGQMFRYKIRRAIMNAVVRKI